MKATAEILKFEGKELRTAADITAVQEALMSDLLSGEITAAEAREIQKEIKKRLRVFGSAVKALTVKATLAELALKLNRRT